ncbi:MAG: transposase [Pyrinomonadaceae bacterium]|nr:transposase [Pyrinomonadaceae bacterium]
MNEQLCLFAHLPTTYSFPKTYGENFSCAGGGDAVSCVQQMNSKAPPVALTTGEAVHPNVIQHAQATFAFIVRQPRPGVNRKDEGTMEAREAKGLALAASVQPHRQSNVFTVPSQQGCKTYVVDLSAEPPSCTCPDHAERRQVCKHIFAAQYALQREAGATLPDPPPVVRPTYRQAWPEYNLGQTQEKGYFQDLLYQLCQGLDEPVRQGRGRPSMKLADLIFAACVKTYEGLSGRRNQTDMREALGRGFLSRKVHYNTIFKYLEMESLTPYLHHLITESSLPLKAVEVDFAVDSSGFSTCNYVRWYDVKYGNTEDWHDWIKLHLITGVKTNIVTSCEVSRRYANDSPYFKPLVTKTAAAGFQMREVSADKEYLSAGNIRLTLLKGAQPYIPFKVNSVPGKNTTVWNRMLNFYHYHQEEFNAHYHKRSNVEATFWMIKSKFGERLRSKTETAQMNEALTKVLCHNICCVIQSIFELGLEVEFMGKSPICP